MNKNRMLIIVLFLTIALMAACQKTPTPTAVPGTPTVEVVATFTLQVPPSGTPTAVATSTLQVVPTDTPAQPVQPTSTLAPATAAQTPSPTAMAAAAIVNGQPIPLADYQRQVALAEAFYKKQAGGKQDAETQAALQQVGRQVLDWMIDQVLIEQAAEHMGITISDAQVEAELEKARGEDRAQFQRWLEANGLTEETFKAKLRSELLGAAMRDAATSYIPERMEQVRLRHILVSSEDEARDLLRQIRSPEDFVRLAQQYSKDMGTREVGGDLGWYPRGILSPEIDRVAFSMVIGQVSDVIRTSFGYHIIQIIDRDLNRPLAPEMLTALRQQAFMDWLQAERARAKIEYLVGQ